MVKDRFALSTCFDQIAIDDFHSVFGCVDMILLLFCFASLTCV